MFHSRTLESSVTSLRNLTIPSGLTLSRSTLLALVFASAFAVAQTTPIQSERNLKDLIQKEEEVLSLTAKAEDLPALQKALSLLQSTCEQAAAPGASAAILAHAEFQFWTASQLARLQSGHSEFAAALQQIATRPLPPRIQTLVHYFGAHCAYRMGNTALLEEHTQKLGYITRWVFMGPFDNERGGGFARSDEPEKGFAPDLVTRGKERDVRWRDLPSQNIPLGQIPLSDLMRPNQQAHVYLRTTFQLAQSQTLQLHTSSSEALRVWVDGKLMLEKNVRRDLGFDQDTIALQCSEGTHEILVKVCTQEKGWKFACRATNAQGAPVLDLATDPRRVAGDSGRGTSELSSTEGTQDALTYFSKIAALDPSGTTSRPAPESGAAGADQKLRAGAAFRYAFLLQMRHAEDDATPLDRDPARLAAEIAPEVAAYRNLYATSLRQKTQTDEEKELNPFRRELEKAWEADSTNAVAAFELAKHYDETLQISETRRLWLERARRAAPANLRIVLAWSEFLHDHDLDFEGTRVVEDAEKLPGANRSAQVQERLGMIDYYKNRFAESEKHLRRAIELDRVTSNRAQDALRQLLSLQGREDELMRVLEEDLQLLPFSTWQHVEKARIHLARRKRAEMESEFESALAICPEDATIHASLAQALSLLDDMPVATRALEMAVTLDPKDRTNRRYLEFLKSNVKPFEDAFRVDATELLKSPPKSIAGADEPFEVLYYQVAFKLNDDGATQKYEHVVARILNEEGTKQLDTYGVRHNSEDEQVRIRKARVFRKDGKIDEAPTSPGAAWVKFPPVSPGDIIDVESRVDTVKLGVFGNYFGVRHPFHALGIAPTNFSEQIYVAPATRKLHFKQRNGAPEPVVMTDSATGLTAYRFKMTDVQKPTVEPSMPDTIELVPSVSVSTYGTWEEFTAWWWNLIEKECQSSPAIKDKVTQLIQGKKTDVEKMRAIYDFVVTDVRYNAWEFGVHGYRPYQASTIFDRQYGDCKDKAILIRTMLADAGIESHPVLIYADETRPKEDLSLPMVELFNHCIAYVPEAPGRPGMFLDGTATHHPMGVLPDMDYGAHVVVVNNGKPDLRVVAYPEPMKNRDVAELKFEIQQDGSARGSAELKPSGNFDVRLREFFGNEAGAQKENLERFLSPALGRTKVGELETSNLQDLGVPVSVKATLEVEKLARSKGADLTLPLTISPRRMLARASEVKRTHDLLLGTPDYEETLVEYKLPEGLSVRSIPQNESLQSPFGEYKIETTVKDQVITVRSSSTITKARITPEEYEAFREFARKMDEAEAREITLKTR